MGGKQVKNIKIENYGSTKKLFSIPSWSVTVAYMYSKNDINDNKKTKQSCTESNTIDYNRYNIYSNLLINNTVIIII